MLARVIDGRIEKFTCDEVRKLHLDWKREFREQNGTDEIMRDGGRDKVYEAFCGEIDDFLENKCEKIALVCDKCAPEDHEGYHCRCEGRNIALSKQLRADGMSGWQKKD